MKSRFAVLIAIFTILCACLVWAQNEDSVIDNWPNMEYEGKLLQMKWEPAGKSVKIFVTGYEAAAIKFKDMEIEASYGIGNGKKTLVVKRNKDHFLVDNKDDAKNLRLKLKVREDEVGSYDLNLKKE